MVGPFYKIKSAGSLASSQYKAAQTRYLLDLLLAEPEGDGPEAAGEVALTSPGRWITTDHCFL